MDSALNMAHTVDSRAGDLNKEVKAIAGSHKEAMGKKLDDKGLLNKVNTGSLKY